MIPAMTPWSKPRRRKAWHEAAAIAKTSALPRNSCFQRCILVVVVKRPPGIDLEMEPANSRETNLGIINPQTVALDSPERAHGASPPT
jgi:hypothetical protein